MKILLVIPTLKQGGAERVMSELANEFSRKGHEVHICLLAEGKQFYRLETNVTVHTLGFVNKGKVQKVLGEVQVFLKLRELIKVIDLDFVLSFMTKYNALTIMASAFLNVKVFVSDRSNPKKKLPRSIKFLRKFTYPYANGIIAQTSLAKSVLQKQVKNNNIEVIANPLKVIEQFPNIKKENIVLNVGRMVTEKGQKYLMEAFAQLNNDEWKLVILGDGPLYTELFTLAKKLNISHRVEMPGSVKNVDEWLSRASIFAFPSISEGFPNALVEAMSARLPCVSFDCDAGPRDVIENNKNGYLVRTSDTEEFTQKIEDLMENESIRIDMGKEASKIKNKLEPSMIAGEFLKFCTGIGK